MSSESEYVNASIIIKEIIHESEKDKEGNIKSLAAQAEYTDSGQSIKLLLWYKTVTEYKFLIKVGNVLELADVELKFNKKFNEKCLTIRTVTFVKHVTDSVKAIRNMSPEQIRNAIPKDDEDMNQPEPVIEEKDEAVISSNMSNTSDDVDVEYEVDDDFEKEIEIKNLQNDASEIDTELKSLVGVVNPVSSLVVATPINKELKEKLNIDAIKKYICPLANDVEIYNFVQICVAHNLNPFINEIYLVKYSATSKAQIIVAKDTFLKRAKLAPDYIRFEAGVIVFTKAGKVIERNGSFVASNEKLEGSWCRIYRQGNEPFYNALTVKEIHKNQSTWNQMPNLMSRKTAIVNCFRECYPETLFGLYVGDELGIDEPKED